MKFHHILRTTIVATIVYLLSKVVPTWGEFFYISTYYGSLPWTYPWFQPPFQLCLNDCSDGLLLALVHYLGFVINVLLSIFFVRWIYAKYTHNNASQ